MRLREQAVQGTPVRVSVPAEFAGTEVTSYLLPAPTALGAQTVGRNGGFSVRLPDDVAGEFRIAVYAADGELIGWDDLTVKTGDDAD